MNEYEYNGFGGALYDLDVCAIRLEVNIFETPEETLRESGFIYNGRDYRISFLTESGEKNTVIVKGKNLFSKIKELNAQGCRDGTILGPLHEV